MATMRKSVPLGDDDIRAATALRSDPAWREVALEMGASVSADPSEAEALRILVEVGRRSLSERVAEREMQAGYAALARSMTPEDHAIARHAGRRAASRSE